MLGGSSASFVGKKAKKAKRGGAAAAQPSIAQGRNLLLCYPDDRENLSMQCLQRFEGSFIIHVGELGLLTGTKAGDGQNPWGKTTDSEFQVTLAEKFHCVLVAKIPSLPISSDYISVWKRSEFVTVEDEDDDFVDEDGSAVVYRSLPASETLPDLTRAAPMYQHLLR